jgi:hypothetical protein
MIVFTSLLPVIQRSELESLMFLNPGQNRVRASILAVIESHGVPSVVVVEDRLRVQLKGGPEVQTLYAISNMPGLSQLVGVLVYTRTEPSVIAVLHIVVEESFSSHGTFSKSMLAMRLIAKLRETAGQIKGVGVLRLLYGNGPVRDIPI